MYVMSSIDDLLWVYVQLHTCTHICLFSLFQSYFSEVLFVYRLDVMHYLLKVCVVHIIQMTVFGTMKCWSLLVEWCKLAGLPKTANFWIMYVLIILVWIMYVLIILVWIMYVLIILFCIMYVLIILFWITCVLIILCWYCCAAFDRFLNL